MVMMVDPILREEGCNLSFEVDAAVHRNDACCVCGYRFAPGDILGHRMTGEKSGSAWLVSVFCRICMEARYERLSAAAREAAARRALREGA